MRVKTFEAMDMKQAMQLVKQELGPRAVIVASRAVRKDARLFGLLGRKVLEVTAASDEAGAAAPAEVQGARAPELPAGPPAPGSVPATHAGRGRAGALYRDIWAVKQAVEPVIDEVRALRDTLGAPDESAQVAASELRSDISQIRSLLSSMLASPAFAPDAQGAAAQRLFYFLLGRGIDEPLARSLVQRVVARVETGGLADLDRLKLNLAAEMRADLCRAERGRPPSRVQLFVGPTGVGKTTTIAKLAARAARSHPRGVQIITTDVHRVAAVEQIARFGEMLSVPVEVALGPDDLARALDKAAERELVFVDTPGRSHRDATALRALQHLVAAAGDCEVLLVNAATTRAADARDVLEAYREVPWSRLVVTKLDETRVYGELYNSVVHSGRPLACVATGQAVPEHLESLDVAGILRKVLHG
jgi:flagellar biosynthesis protein FlhF